MNDLRVFQNTEFGEIEVVVIEGKEYFPATQCARLLGYVEPQSAIRQHCKADGCVKHTGVSITVNQHGKRTEQIVEKKYINEGNLYRLIAHSKLPQAERFERWVFDEVLPSIRKTGGYGKLDIQQIVATTTCEVMKQIMPIVKTMVQSAADTINPPEPRRPKRSNKRMSKISRLHPEIQNAVVDMLVGGRYTYEEIAAWLRKKGVSVSLSALSRYYGHLKET